MPKICSSLPTAAEVMTKRKGPGRRGMGGVPVPAGGKLAERIEVEFGPFPPCIIA